MHYKVSPTDSVENALAALRTELMGGGAAR